MASAASPNREIARIAVPVSAEFVVLLILNFVNQIIVGTLGAVAIAAVGFANSLSFIVLVTLNALGISVTILVARAYGAQRRHEMGTTVSSAAIIGGALAALFGIVMAIWAEPLLRLMGASPSVAAEGTGFLRLVSLSLLPNVLSAVLSGVLRSTGRARLPMIATFISAGLSALLSWGLVIGFGPLPALGVPGAGWAVLIGALVKLAILVPMVFREAPWETPSREELRHVLKPLFVLAIPLGLTELVWTTGTFLYNVVFQRLGDDPLAAAQIANALEGIFIVGSLGLMTAATALIGRAVGEGNEAGIHDWIRRLSRAGLLTSIVFGGLYLLSALAVPLLFPNAGVDVRHMAVIGIVINALTQPVKVANMVFGGGVLPSGSDVKGVIIGDAIGAFAVGIPLAVVLGLFTPLGVVGIFLARSVEEAAKLFIFRARAHRVDWTRLISAHRAETA